MFCRFTPLLKGKFSALKLISAGIVGIRVSGYPLSLRCVLKFDTAVVNVVSEEFVQRSLSASPSMKPLLTPGGWELEKCVY